ncbi:hypothetical protein ABPG74_006855 [Tetrahymena malaccensis]
MNQNNSNCNSELEQEIKDVINLQTNNNRRKTYSEEYKQKVIGLTNKYNYVSHRTLALMLELNESQIRRWIKSGGKNKTRGSKKVISEDHDYIKDYFKKVSNRSAVLYAKKLAKELNLDLRCSSGITIDDSGPSTLSIVGEKQIKVKTNNKEKFQVSFGVKKQALIRRRYQQIYGYLLSWKQKQVWRGRNDLLYQQYPQTLFKNSSQEGSHKTVHVLDAVQKINFIHYLLLPNSTSFLQPNDQQINKHIKQEYRKFWEEEFEKDMQQEDTKQQFNQFVNQIAKIVRDIPSELVKASWQMYLNPTHLQIDDPQICQVNQLQNEENNNDVDNEDKLNDYGIWASKNYESIISNEILTQDKQDENIVYFEGIHSSDTSVQEISELESENQDKIPTTKPIINQKYTKYNIKSYFK